MTRAACDWRDLELDPRAAAHRRILIEASAGTGKTWTISVLYLRLIVEQGLRPEAIVVSTFTEAAAAELRERIRARLQWALRWSAGAVPASPDEVVVQSWLDAAIEQVSVAEVQWRLQCALAELERAPIATLHALCKRVLSEQALAAGTSLRIGELVSDEALRDELFDDLTRWLAHAAGDDERSGLPALARMAPAARATLMRAALQPGVTVLGGDVDELFALFDDAEAPMRLRDFAATLPMQSRKTALRKRLGELADWIAVRNLAGEVDDKPLRDLLSDTYWRDQIDPARVDAVLADPVAAFARHAASVLTERDAILCAQGARRVLPMLAEWRSARLAEREQFTFDELIARVHAETTAPRDDGDALADRLHAQWPVALIDEFQDTDARQWAIFDALHRDRDGAARGLLLLIGDPKQAVYGFRGGDIATYLRAAATTTQRLTLAVNQRATHDLVAATNALYAASTNPFAMDDGTIRYVPVQAAGRADRKPLHRTDAGTTASLQLHVRDGDALEHCADLIAAQLAPGRWKLGDRALAPGDIAVLLPRRDDIVDLRERLQRLRIPCVGAGRNDVFASIWATELRVVLHALADPADAGALRAALATRLFAATDADLRRYAVDDAAWRAQVDRFAQWSEHWQRHGVLHAIDRIIAANAPHLLARVDGERALTDLRHLGELAQAEAHVRPGRQQLLAWFANQCASAGDAQDARGGERELRIESDAGRVQLMTLHASKGLEFPVVLLPLMDMHRGRRDEYPVWNDPARGARCVDLGSARVATHRACAARESARERARVLYVALTRAQHACHLLLPEDDAPAGADGSAWAGLLQGIDLAQLGVRCPQVAVIDVRERVMAPLPVADPPSPRQARSWPARRRIDAAYSFSSLMARAHAWRDDDAARDEQASGISPTGDDRDAGEPRLGALSDWRGTEFGNVVHAVFDHRAIGRPMREQRALVHEQLARSGLRVDASKQTALVDALIERVQATLDADLGRGLRLGDLDERAQRAEMDFQFRLDALDIGRLRALCERSGEAGLIPDGLGETELRGFLSGKIDLVLVHDAAVHVLDYKSNHLGNALADYGNEALQRAMGDHAYRWQALLYAVAVRRYLARRQRADAQPLRLGDVIYLFVRAVGLAPGSGVWRHRFAPDFLNAVDALFATSAAEAG